MTLRMWQVCFKVEQLNELYPFSTPYWNDRLTPYFENTPICELVPQSQADYVSVCSWALRRKRNTGGAEVILKNTYGTTDLTEEMITETDADVMILTPVKHRDILVKLYAWHGDSARKAVAEFNKFMKFPEEVKHAIYENHFVARKEIYLEYVETCLKPCIEFMSEREVFSLPSGYRQKKERLAKTTNEVAETLAKLGGVSDYPIAPFILERLFSIWIDKKNLKVVPR